MLINNDAWLPEATYYRVHNRIDNVNMFIVACLINSTSRV